MKLTYLLVATLFIMISRVHAGTYNIYPGPTYVAKSTERACRFEKGLSNPVVTKFSLVCDSYGNEIFSTRAKYDRSKWNKDNMIVRVGEDKFVKTKSGPRSLIKTIAVKFVNGEQTVLRASCSQGSFHSLLCHSEEDGAEIVKGTFHGQGHLLRSMVPVANQRFFVAISNDLQPWQEYGLLMVVHAMLSK